MMANKLIGIWKADSSHLPTLELYGSNVTMEFKENGELIYFIEENNKAQTILLTYEIDGDKLITDQPSMPGKEITQFNINGNHVYSGDADHVFRGMLTTLFERLKKKELFVDFQRYTLSN